MDLWFESRGDPAIADAARAVGGAFVSRTSPPMLAGEGLDRLDVVTRCQGLKSFAAEYAKAVDLPIADFSIKILPIERVIASKRAAGRPKDKAVLDALRATVVALQEAKKMKCGLKEI